MKCFLPKTPKLDTVVIVERLTPTATIDGSGNIDETLEANWVQYGREWAKVVTRGSREFVSNDQVREDVTHQWTIRYSSRAKNYTTAMRLKMNGRTFHIDAPPLNIDERNEWIRIDTVETASV